MIPPAVGECMTENAGSGERAAPTWQAALRDAVRDIGELTEILTLPAEDSAALHRAQRDFPLLVPRAYVAKIRRGDPRDPLLLQILPRAAEAEAHAGFGPDPLEEHALATDGVLRKYAGRALLIASAACPVHCRYCFRRAFPYAEQTASRDDWRAAVAELARSPDISEVILSGGDPLSLSNRRIRRLLQMLETVGSIETLRIHTRFPIVLPQRVDPELSRLLEATPLKTVVVLHCNHAAELGADVEAALGRLARHADVVLNQSVLLRGVNDSAAALAALSKRLFACGVLPYYLHLLDRVAGSAHFDVGAERAKSLLAELRAVLPGYLVPRLVREIPGEPSKTPV